MKAEAGTESEAEAGTETETETETETHHSVRMFLISSYFLGGGSRRAGAHMSHVPHQRQTDRHSERRRQSWAETETETDTQTASQPASQTDRQALVFFFAWTGPEGRANLIGSAWEEGVVVGVDLSH
eukprot:221367-Rhodomonas_salina.1